MEFSIFDARKYPTLAVQDGYAEWAPTYEASVCDEMDLRLFDRMTTVDWPGATRALDLACGTGRTGAWLRGRGVRAIDGVDLTPAMLERARAKDVYARLFLGDVLDTKRADAAYDLVTMSLADEHLADLAPLYREAARVAAPGASFVLVGYHPHFLMSGIPTHYDRAPGDSVAIASHVHLTSDHVKAAHAAGFALLEMDESVVDETWIAKKPKWSKYRGRPVSFAFVWRRAASVPSHRGR